MRINNCARTVFALFFIVMVFYYRNLIKFDYKTRLSCWVCRMQRLSNIKDTCVSYIDLGKYVAIVSKIIDLEIGVFERECYEIRMRNGNQIDDIRFFKLELKVSWIHFVIIFYYNCLFCDIGYFHGAAHHVHILC